MGEYGTNKGITNSFIDHINGISPTKKTPPKLLDIINEIDTDLAENYGTCRLCKMKGSKESPSNILLECPYTWQGQAELCNMYDINYIPTNWEPAKLVQFYACYTRKN